MHIQFTCLPNELHEIIGSLKMQTKQSSSAAALGFVPPKSNQEKLNVVTSLWERTNAGVLNIQNLVLLEASNLNRALGMSAQKKRRRYVIESSEPCLRLTRGKFEFTNQDSGGGKNSLSSRQCKLTGKALKSSNFSHWRLP